MDIKRLEDLPRDNWIKLHHYKAKEFEDIFTHLTNSEISNLDLMKNRKRIDEFDLCYRNCTWFYYF